MAASRLVLGDEDGLSFALNIAFGDTQTLYDRHYTHDDDL
jgi:hypothetical protein